MGRVSKWRQQERDRRSGRTWTVDATHRPAVPGPPPAERYVALAARLVASARRTRQLGRRRPSTLGRARAVDAHIERAWHQRAPATRRSVRLGAVVSIPDVTPGSSARPKAEADRNAAACLRSAYRDERPGVPDRREEAQSVMDRVTNTLDGLRRRPRAAGNRANAADDAAREAGAGRGSVACGACGERICLQDFVLVGGENAARLADCPACGETTIISLVSTGQSGLLLRPHPDQRN